ncbi:MAG TPA: hypothetical protein VJ464_15970 [Blastocatellia bacterium]|nr:hypothetical protein [Blastocatellia bacterium]
MSDKKHEGNDWRKKWDNDLIYLIDQVDEPFRSGYQELLLDLDQLSRDQAQERWDAIQKLSEEGKQ